MSASDPSRRLSALIKRVRARHPGDAPAPDHPPETDPLVNELLQAFLVWEAGTGKAAGAFKRMMGAVVDYNELRVCLPDEMVAALGERYPRALERAARMRSALNEVYRREHCVTLERLREMAKREARDYLASLDGAPPFVADRVTLLALGGHVFPLDERLHAALTDEGAVPGGAALDEARQWLERQFRAGEIADAYRALEAWATERPQPRTPKRPKSEARRPPVRRAGTAAARKPKPQPDPKKSPKAT